LDEQGITLAEAARIQPSYVKGEDGSVGVGDVAVIAGGARAIVGTAVGTSIWNTRGNATGRSQFGNVLGVTSGILTTVIGASIAGSSEGMVERGVGVATAVAGGVSVALGARGFSRRSRAKAAVRDRRPGQENARGARPASIAPIFAMGRNPSAGMAMQIRF
jgi:hypothetical protein